MRFGVVLAGLVLTLGACTSSGAPNHPDPAGASIAPSLDDQDARLKSAWDAAERTHGAHTTTLEAAFALARHRLANGHRREAVEPAQRVLGLLDQRVEPVSFSRDEAEALNMIATVNTSWGLSSRFSALEGAVNEINAEQSLEWNRIARLGWMIIAERRIDYWEETEALDAVMRAIDLLGADPEATLDEHYALARIVAMASVALVRHRQHDGQTELALQYADAGVAKVSALIELYPPQPPEQPVDPDLGDLVAWEGLLRTMRGEIEGASVQSTERRWTEGRYVPATCEMNWLSLQVPDFPYDWDSISPAVAGAFEYQVRMDGTVGDVRTLNRPNPPTFFQAAENAITTWRAEPLSDPECAGRRVTTVAWMLDFAERRAHWTP